jgi:hypothetical protein
MSPGTLKLDPQNIIILSLCIVEYRYLSTDLKRKKLLYKDDWSTMFWFLFRDDETMYVEAKADRVTVIFSTIFKVRYCSACLSTGFYILEYTPSGGGGVKVEKLQ